MQMRTDKAEVILKAAEQLFETNQSVSVRNIAEKAGVADGLLTHHFGSYSGLVATLTDRLNQREAKELTKFQASRGRSQLDTALDFFQALARLDLNRKNCRLRRMSCEMSWKWSLSDESKLAGSVTTLLEPLWKQLKFESDVKSDDLLLTLWAIYLLPLRLALNNTLLPASVVNTEENQVGAIIAYIRPKFGLVLESK